MAIPKEFEGYDWEQVFGAAGETGDYTVYNPGVPYLAVPPGHPDKDTPQPGFTRHDVARVIATWTSNGKVDEPDWACVVELRDGRFASLTGGCDYTGWD